jgi:hypothetical protein
MRKPCLVCCVPEDLLATVFGRLKLLPYEACRSRPSFISPSATIASRAVGTRIAYARSGCIFELSTLSAGAAAELAGGPKTVFLQQFSRDGVPVFSTIR